MATIGQLARLPKPVWLAVIGLTALTVRLWHIHALSASALGSMLVGDPRQYVQWAQTIADGDWVGSVVFYQTPLYPYLLGLLFSVTGPSLEAVRLLQTVAGSASCVLVAWAGARFFGWAAGITAGVLLAIHPAAVFFDGLIQKSSLDLLLVSALLAATAATLDGTRRRWVVAMGLSLGLLLINRESARLFYPLLLAWLLTRAAREPKRRRAGVAILFTVMVALPVLPVAARNYLVGGEWLISTSQLGSTFYIGNHRGATGLYVPLVVDRGSAEFERQDATRLAEEAVGRSLSAAEVSDYWLDRALDDVRADPWAWLRLMGHKAWLVVSATEAMDTESLAFHADHSPVLGALGWMTFGMLLPFAAAGAWVTRREWQRLWVLHGLVALILASAALFIVIDRYRYPAVPVLMLFAGVGLVRIREWAAMPPPARLAGAVIVGSLAVVGNWPVVMPTDASYANVGAQLLRDERAEDAVWYLERSVETSPGHARTYYDLAHAYTRVGRVPDAVRALERLVVLAPAEAEGHRMLAISLLQVGRRDEALAAARRAAELAPDSVSVLETLGNLHGQTGDVDKAIELYERTLAIDPDHATTLNNMANLLAAFRTPAEAVPYYRRAIAVAPDYAEARSNLALALERAGEVEAAIEEMAAAIRAQPGRAQLRINLGDLLLRHSRPDEARAAFEAAVGLDDGDANAAVAARVRLASMQINSGQAREALALLTEAHAIASASGQTAVADQVASTIYTLRQSIGRE